jgi:hypothetical protein
MEKRFTKLMVAKAGRSKTLISHKEEFKLKLARRDKERHLILIKGAIHQEEIIIINLCVPNASTPNFTKQTLIDLKREPNRVDWRL